MFHGIYAIRTMTSSQSKTPSHLNSSTQSQPIGYKITSWEKEASIHILGVKGIDIRMQNTSLLTAAYSRGHSSPGFIIRECDL